MIIFSTYDSPIGRLTLEASENALEAMYFEGEIGEVESSTNMVLELAKNQLEEYFSGKRQTFSVPLSIKGTDFRKKVWNELLEIPYGETRSYGEVALCIGNPKASRAVGGACNANHLPIFIPCHRVIGGGGKLVGFANGLPTKIALLKLEGIL